MTDEAREILTMLERVAHTRRTCLWAALMQGDIRQVLDEQKALRLVEARIKKIRGSIYK